MTQKPENRTSDEALVVAFIAGDQTALDTLCQRYYEQVYYYLLKKSLVKESPFLEDIRQEVFLTVCQLIKSEVFTPRGEGSFRAYLFTTAQNICRTKNRRKAKEPKDIYGKLLELIPAKPVISPDETADKKARLKARLARILDKLSPQEQKLMRLINIEGKDYKEIHALPEFSNYSLDYLMRKVYIIRRKILKAKDSL